MKQIDLYEEVKRIFELPDEIITLREMLKTRISENATDTLYIYPIHSAKKYQDNEAEGIYYRAMEDILYTKFLRGRIFKEIIFID